MPTNSKKKKKPTGLYQSNGRGTWVIDRRIKGLGLSHNRFRMATGTENGRTAEAINGMLTALIQVGRLDVLKRLASKKMTLLEAYALHLQGDLLTAGRREGLQSTEAWEQWVNTFECSEDWRAQLRKLLRRLLADRNLRYEDLPDRLRAFRAEVKGKPTLFNHAKCSLQSYVRHTIGRLNPVYMAISDVQRMRERPVKGKALSLDDLAALLRKLRKEVRDDCRSMVTTGMGPKEYIYDGWELSPEGGIRIHGQKTAKRDRIVPLIIQPTPPQRSYSVIYSALNKLGCSPYSLRHTYKRLLEDSGIPLTRIQAYMGHAASSMTDSYGRYDVTPHLVEDAEAVRSLLKKYPDFFPDKAGASARRQL